MEDIGKHTGIMPVQVTIRRINVKNQSARLRVWYFEGGKIDMIYTNTGKNMLRRLRAAFPIAAISLLAIAPIEAQDSSRPMGWTAESHGNSVPANYELVLPDDHINEIYISFSAESWRAEVDDMIALYGERGTGEAFARGGFGGPGGFGQRMQPMIAELAEALYRSEDTVLEALALVPDFAAVAAELEKEADELFEAIGLPSGLAPQFGRGGDGAPGGRDGIGGGGNLQLVERNPIWVPVTIQFDDQTWWEVGFRFKGNSTLSTGWRTGTVGLPFKLDFDEFEDDFPELKNQRFFGFKQLSFANNAFDPFTTRKGNRRHLPRRWCTRCRDVLLFRKCRYRDRALAMRIGD